MTNPKTYAFDLEKLSEKLGDAVYIFSIVGVTEEHENFEKLKPYLLGIPEPRKSLEEIQKELDDNFEELWARTKLKFDISKQTAEYHYNKKFDNIIDNFEYARTHGSFPQKLTITGNVGSYLVTTNSGINWTSNTRLFNCDDSVGYWNTNMNLQVYTNKKPSRIVRWFTKLLLDFDWKSK